jgi:NitT/TauT family transport system substrate-binding protein
VLARAGVAPADVPVIGVGAGASAVAAMRRGELDALVHLDPVISQLEAAGEIKVVLDTRTREGAEAVYGGVYHAACLYATKAYLDAHPGTVAALAGAQIRALQWLARATIDEIMGVVPPSYWGADRAIYRAALAKNRAAWSPDGQLDRAGAQHVLQALAAFEPFVRAAHIEVSELIDNRFGDRARDSAR